MKRCVLFCLAVLLVVSLLACGKTPPETKGKLKIVATVFPLYDFARNLCGDCGEVSLLLKSGASAHSYEPTPQDLIAISQSDLFLYVGGESDEPIEAMLVSAEREASRSLRLIEAITPIAEADEPEESDEHIWTSPACAKQIVTAIAESLCAQSPENADTILQNRDTYLAALAELDAGYRAFAAKGHTLVFADRFPFAYLARDYELDCLAAVSGCGEDGEPSASRLSELIRTVREKRIPTVFYTETSDQRIANSVSAECGCKTALLHSCHNLTRTEQNEGSDYLSLMRRNLETLNAAFD